MTLLVICPSRGRPENVARLLQAWADTKATADLIVAVDDDDPTLPAYRETGATLHVGPRQGHGMCGALNTVATLMAPRVRYIGFLGDDHVVQTAGWDALIVGALDQLGTGVVYGNDLLQGQALPTAVFITASIVTRLGYMVPPGIEHLYADNFWLALGHRVGLRYLPDVIIEHLHPNAGKASNDAGYERVNAGRMYEHDLAAFESYMQTRFEADVARLQGEAP